MNIPGPSILNGISWSAFERLSVQGVQFAVFVFMARMLTPTDYGLVGMLTFFIVLSHIFADGGLSQTIIRKLDRNDDDCATAFTVNVVAALVLYGLLWAVAPAIARFFNEPSLVSIMRVLALCVPIQASLVVHRALLTARLDFKTQAKSTMVGALLAGAVGLTMAYRGFGVWAIVGLQLTNQLACAVTLWVVTEWRPRRLFSRASFGRLYGFGVQLMLINLASNLYQSVYSAAIGKRFTAYALGCYTNACQIGDMTSANLSRIVERAVYPVLVQFQHEPERLRRMLYGYLRTSTFFIAPMMFGLAAIAEPLTMALIGWQWVYTARLLRIICFFFLFSHLCSVNSLLLTVCGRGRLYLRLQALYVVTGLVLLGATLPFGLSAVCGGQVVTAAVSYLVNAHYAGRDIGLGLLTQLRAIFPIFVCSAIMAATVYMLRFVLEGEWTVSVVGMLVGALLYLVLSVTFLTGLCRQIVGMFRKS